MSADRTPVDLYAPDPPRPAPVIDAERIARVLAESRELVERTRAVLAAVARYQKRVRNDHLAWRGFSPDPPDRA